MYAVYGYKSGNDQIDVLGAMMQPNALMRKFMRQVEVSLDKYNVILATSDDSSTIIVNSKATKQTRIWNIVVPESGDPMDYLFEEFIPTENENE